jgi:hypothetical protein
MDIDPESKNEPSLPSAQSRHAIDYCASHGRRKESAMYAAASLRNPGVTILVAPFTALLKDYVKRLKLSSIDHVVWDHGETRWAPVLVVSADYSMCSDFTTYGFMLGIESCYEGLSSMSAISLTGAAIIDRN